MKKTLLTFLTIIFIFISKQTISLEKGKWTFVKSDNWCYVGSQPLKSDLPKSKKRGDNYILVYKILGSDENIVQIEAGYNYKLEKQIIVKIDNSSFNFYTTEDSSDTAWTNNDIKVIGAMKKGLKLVLTSESSRGTVTNDTYSLKGFTKIINQLNKDC